MVADVAARNAICQLTDAEGTPLGGQLDLPQSTRTAELQVILNSLLPECKYHLLILSLRFLLATICQDSVD